MVGKVETKLSEYGTEANPLYSAKFPELFHVCTNGTIGFVTLVRISETLPSFADSYNTNFLTDFNQALNLSKERLTGVKSLCV